MKSIPCLVAVLGALVAVGQTQEATITVHAEQAVHRVSRYLTGACIEDVNHEIYGGIDSQMIFGESFAEPPPPRPLKGLKAYGGRWTPEADGTLSAAAGDGPKLLCDGPGIVDGEVSVEMRFSREGSGNAGLIVKVSDAANGADKFSGYEVALDPAGKLVLGRHRQDWEPIRQVPCDVPLNEWVTLQVRMSATTLEIFVNGQSVTRYEDVEHPLSGGTVGLRTWQMDAGFRNLTVTAGGGLREIPFEYAERSGWGAGVSGMWRAMQRGTADGRYALEAKAGPGSGQSQQIVFASGNGQIGIENQSLNRWGMNFVKGKTYEGYLLARSEAATELFVSLESRDGVAVYAEKSLKLNAGDWQRLDFVLKPNTSDKAGRFAIKLKQPATVALDYALLQPGPWGRFQGLPVRQNVAQGLIDQGVTVLRYGGSMVNAAEYRWKKMIGPRAHRPPYAGWWYPHASNGWGIIDFLNLCEAAGFVSVPDLNAGETPQDMADFVEYVNGSKDTPWGGRRAIAGHPEPYHLKYLEVGNEEQINESYWQKFKPIAEAVWAKDPSLILVVGDFAYDQPISDPFHFSGAAGGMTTLSAHQKILQLAKQHDREVWFDVHVGTEGPRPSFGGTFSYIDALDKLAQGARHRVVIFEFNAGNHSLRRALANAAAINAVERDGRVPIATSANCLQPDGQNDNGWDQGLLFLNPSQVWLQPPGYVTRMISGNHQPLLVNTEVQSYESVLDVSAKRSEDNQTLVLQVVNVGERPTTAALSLAGFAPRRTVAQVQTLAGPLYANNTADHPEVIKPSIVAWKHGLKDGRTTYTFPANSLTVIRFE